MGKVKVLSEDLVALISAGEVIENPASIIKELIENSLDAGATLIDIEIRMGGIEYISVSDDGSGIQSDDCLVCLQRYSTSKVASKADIDAIGTFGFRGEALASIAAVSEMRITTHAEDEELGTVVMSRVGDEPRATSGARPTGTTVEVFRLFEKIPARLKHLNSPKVEGQRVLELIMRHAALKPNTGFRFTRDEVSILNCPPHQSATERIAMLWGTDTAGSLAEVDHIEDGISVSGFIARPPVSRGNRSREYFSINERPIINEYLSHAVETEFRTRLMAGQYPVFALDISMNLDRVDVNVHPTKREVRILDIERVANVLRASVASALSPDIIDYEDTTLDDVMGWPTTSMETGASTSKQASGTSDERLSNVPLIEQTLLQAPTAIPGAESVDFLQGVFKIVGQIHNLYILLEFEDGLLFVDQHAAHERILYEQLKESMDNGTVGIQDLLQPIILSLNVDDFEKVMRLKEPLSKLGYAIDSFGGNDIAISSLPDVFGRRANEKDLLSFVDRANDLGIDSATDLFMDELIKLTACHSAVRSGQSLDTDEIRQIITQLRGLKRKFNCCHGRPSMLKIFKNDLDRRFGRLGPEALARFRARHGLKE